MQWEFARGDEASDEVPSVSNDALDASLRRLMGADLVTGQRTETAGIYIWTHLRVTADGLRVLGEWPRIRGAGVDQALILLLRGLAEGAPSEEQAKWYRRAAGAVGRFGTAVISDVVLGEIRRAGMLETNWLSEQPHRSLHELTEQEVHYAVETLHDAGFVSYDKREPDGAGGVLWLGFQITGAGEQILGEWPMFEALGQPAHLAAVLDDLAAMASSDEEEANLRGAAGGIRELGTEALEEFAAGALAALVRTAV